MDKVPGRSCPTSKWLPSNRAFACMEQQGLHLGALLWTGGASD